MPPKVAVERPQKRLKLVVDTTLTLDKDGDLVLTIVGPEKAELRCVAQSSILRLASPVFAVLLHGPFKEATELRKNGKVEIKLEEDHPQAMAYILRILHHRLGNIPQSLSLEVLAQIAIQADKYDCVKSLRFCIGTWTPQLLQAMDGKDLDELVLGLVALYLFRSKEFSAAVAAAAGQIMTEYVEDMKEHEFGARLPTSAINALRGFLPSGKWVGDFIIDHVKAELNGSTYDHIKPDAYCTPQSRVFRFLHQLHHEGMWPKPPVLDQSFVFPMQKIKAGLRCGCHASPGVKGIPCSDLGWLDNWRKAICKELESETTQARAEL